MDARLTEGQRDALWDLVTAKSEELVAAEPGWRSSSRGGAMLHCAGATISSLLEIQRHDGTNVVHHVEATWWNNGGPEVNVTTWFHNSDAFWLQQAADRSNSVVIDHHHFRVFPDKPPGHTGSVGHGGSRFRIEPFDGGPIIETRNLWHQGLIPLAHWHMFPDTARFLPVGPPRTEAVT